MLPALVLVGREDLNLGRGFLSATGRRICRDVERGQCHMGSQPAHLNEESLSVCRDRPGQQSTRDGAENAMRDTLQEDYTSVKNSPSFYSAFKV